MISGNEVSWHYACKKGKKKILDQVSFSLEKGRISAFIGKSGAGKTTLLKCIAHLNAQYEGEITCDGKNLKNVKADERATTVGCVLQQFHLFPHFTVLQNCTYALKRAADAEERAVEVLSQLGMLSFVHAYPSQLSGGQQQRVAIARALVLRPQILLLDEPTSALDPESKKSLEMILRDLQSQGLTLVLSSHDMPFIKRVMDCIYYLEDGKLIESCDRLLEDPASKEKIKEFLFHH